MLIKALLPLIAVLKGVVAEIGVSKALGSKHEPCPASLQLTTQRFEYERLPTFLTLFAGQCQVQSK